MKNLSQSQILHIYKNVYGSIDPYIHINRKVLLIMHLNTVPLIQQLLKEKNNILKFISFFLYLNTKNKKYISCFYHVFVNYNPCISKLVLFLAKTVLKNNNMFSRPKNCKLTLKSVVN